MNRQTVNASAADPAMLGFIAGYLTGRGKLGDSGAPRRPWLHFTSTDPGVVEAARETFVYTGSIAPVERSDGARVWRFYLYGDAALYALSDLFPYLQGETRSVARRLLNQWENN